MNFLDVIDFENFGLLCHVYGTYELGFKFKNIILIHFNEFLSWLCHSSIRSLEFPSNYQLNFQSRNRRHSQELRSFVVHVTSCQSLRGVAVCFNKFNLHYAQTVANLMRLCATTVRFDKEVAKPGSSVCILIFDSIPLDPMHTYTKISKCILRECA